MLRTTITADLAHAAAQEDRDDATRAQGTGRIEQARQHPPQRPGGMGRGSHRAGRRHGGGRGANGAHGLR